MVWKAIEILKAGRVDREVTNFLKLLPAIKALTMDHYGTISDIAIEVNTENSSVWSAPQRKER